MKNYEKQFLDRFTGNEAITKNFGVTVKKFYTNTNGTKVDKSTVANDIKTKFPFFLFGPYHYDNAFDIGLKEIFNNQKFETQTSGTLSDYYFVKSFVKGVNNDFMFFTPLNDIFNEIKNGDLCLVYTDNYKSPNYFIWVIIGFKNSGYFGFLKNIPDSLRLNKAFLYTSDNEVFKDEITAIQADYLGIYETKIINLAGLKSPQWYDLGFVEIPLNIMLSKYYTLGGYIPYSSDKLEFTFEFNVL